MGLIIENILDMIEISGEDEVKEELSAFYCPHNSEIDGFLKNKAIDFAKQKLSITYIVSDEKDASILGYFTLAVKALEIDKRSVSKSMIRRISKFALYDTLNDTFTVAAFLLAQFGKNYAVDNGSRISGTLLMQQVELTVSMIQRMIGVGLIYLDVEKGNKTAIDLYSKKNHFVTFDERVSKTDGHEYNVMIRAI